MPFIDHDTDLEWKGALSIWLSTASTALVKKGPLSEMAPKTGKSVPSADHYFSLFSNKASFMVSNILFSCFDFTEFFERKGNLLVILLDNLESFFVYNFTFPRQLQILIVCMMKLQTQFSYWLGAIVIPSTLISPQGIHSLIIHLWRQNIWPQDSKPNFFTLLNGVVNCVG